MLTKGVYEKTDEIEKTAKLKYFFETIFVYFQKSLQNLNILKKILK